MKQLTLTLFFSAISIFSFAQTPFTEQTILDMNKRMMQDFSKFVTEEVSPDYTFTTEDGAVIAYQAMKDFKIKVLEWNTHDLKIKQIGNAAIVRGINKNTIQSATSGAIRNYNLQFIYTYECKNGKWLWFSSHHIYNNPSKADEEVTIKKILDEQVVAFHNADKDIMAKFYINDPKMFHLASGTAGEFWLRDYETTKKALAEMKPTGITPTRSNYQIKIVGNMAVAHYDQENVRKDGTKNIEHNMNVLEKVGGHWKIVGTSVHSNNNNEKPEDVLNLFLTEYHKNPKAFFESRLPTDFRFLNGGKQTVSKDGVLSNSKTDPTDSEISDVKAFQSGNLGIVSGVHVFKNKQSDGNIRADKVNFTYTMVKKNGKWFFAESHHTPLKE